MLPLISAIVILLPDICMYLYMSMCVHYYILYICGLFGGDLI